MTPLAAVWVLTILYAAPFADGPLPVVERHPFAERAECVSVRDALRERLSRDPRGFVVECSPEGGPWKP